jgi:putative phage-type endonuclease
MNPHQQGAEWLNQRTGCLTGSRMADALDRLKNGEPSKKCIDLVRAILAERMTGDIRQAFVNDAMRHGIETEPEARDAYEAHTGNLVTLCGYVPHPAIEYFGASPDGLIDSDGLLEIKCPTAETHIDYLLAGVVPDQYKPQMLAQLACTGRVWCDFVSYHPKVKDANKRLFIRRFEPTTEDIAKIEEQAVSFLDLVDKLFDKVHA